MAAQTTPTEPRARTRAPGSWDVFAAVAAGGSLGAVLRYGASTAWPTAPGSFPWTTFAVNVVGCFALGALMAVLTDANRLARPFLGVGVLGGLTTFSGYVGDIAGLVLAGEGVFALLYSSLTIVSALSAAAAGLLCAKLASRAAVTWRAKR